MATREKQIEEMAKAIDEFTEPLSARDIHKVEFSERFAENLYNAGCRKVVLCDDCYLQGHCIVEDTFNTARMADNMKFCAVGKIKTEVRRDG